MGPGVVWEKTRWSEKGEGCSTGLRWWSGAAAVLKEAPGPSGGAGPLSPLLILTVRVRLPILSCWSRSCHTCVSPWLGPEGTALVLLLGHGRPLKVSMAEVSVRRWQCSLGVWPCGPCWSPEQSCLQDVGPPEAWQGPDHQGSCRWPPTESAAGQLRPGSGSCVPGVW